MSSWHPHAEMYLHFLSKPTLTYDLSFTLLMFVCLLAWSLKIDFKLFFQSSQLMMVRKKNGQAIQMKKSLVREIKTNFMY